MSSLIFLEYKIWTTKLAQPLDVKGLGLISTFYPVTSEDSWLLAQQIGPTSKSKVAFRSRTYFFQASLR